MKSIFTECCGSQELSIDLIMVYAERNFWKSGVLENIQNTEFQKEFVGVLLEIAKEDKKWVEMLFRELYGEDITTTNQRRINKL